MTTLAVRLPDHLVERVDRLVAAGTVASRSELVRRGIELALAACGREAVARSYEDGYARFPETDQELADARRLANAAIDEEPWESWW